MRIVLPFPPKELSPNYSGSLRSKMRAIKAYRDLCWGETKDQVKLWRPKSDGVLHVRLEIYKPDRRHYDDDNLEGRCKRARDGVALALGVDDKRFKVVREVSDLVFKGGQIVFLFLENGEP
jgi:crossover junction endodeoxyribonuclease RusA